MADDDLPTPVSPGMFVVDVAGRREVVYVAGHSDDRWAFWNGQVFRSRAPAPSPEKTGSASPSAQQLAAPMPATVVQVLVLPGAQVKKGQAVVILEAMKMELPVRSLADGTVTAVHCRGGDLVQADAVLVEIA